MMGPEMALPDIQPPSGRGEFLHLPVESIIIEDETFRFRATIRVGTLKESIRRHGQQVPVILRHHRACCTKYQIISGFRRITAIRELGLPTVAAVIRSDLDNDDDAFAASVLENCQRRTYSDLDRALITKAYEEKGRTTEEIAKLLGLRPRQIRNIKAILTLPVVVQEAIDDETKPFSATHGLLIRQMSSRYPDLDYELWVSRTVDEELSISKLKRAINKHHKRELPSFDSIFVPDNTDPGTKCFHLRSVVLNLEEMSLLERQALSRELSLLLDSLSSLG